MKIKIAILLFLISFAANAQLTIKGKVVDSNNNPLPFVNVFLQGTTFGTTTEDDGSFRFKANKRKGILEISFMGYKPQTIKVNMQSKYLNIILTEESDVLDEVVIVTRPKKRLKKKENPAYKILKEIWKRKRKRGLDLVDYYQHKKHEIIEVGLNNLDSVFIKKTFKEKYDDVVKNIQYDSDGVNYYIPIYINEKIINIYGNNKTNKVVENIEAEKQEGLGAEGFVFDRMTNTFKNVNVFKNNFNVLRKSFVSPLSTDGFATYDYLLHDSIVNKKEKLYNIYFFPVRDQDLAFEGNFWVSNKNFAIKTLKMKVAKGANLNFVRELTFEKEFEIRNDSIYLPTKNIYTGDFTLLDKNDTNKGMTIKKTVNYSDYILNKPLASNFYNIKLEKIRPNQYEKDSLYWSKVKTTQNADTYKLINTVKKEKKIKNLTGLLNTVASGYISLPGSFQLGPFWTIFSQNEVEGFKTKLNVRTFKTKDDRFRLSGHVSYGFKNQKINYGAEAKYLLSYKPRITTSVAYLNDVEQLGSKLLSTTQLLGNSFGNAALFTRGTNFFLSSVKKYATNFDYAINNNLHIGFNLSRTKITSASPENFSISYLDENNNIKANTIDTASDIYLSFTPGRFVYGLGVEQRFGKNIYPSVILNYRHGYKDVFNGTHDYNKLQIRYNHPIVLGKIGLLDATVELGKTFGTVPVSLLSPIPADQSYSLVKNTFALMNYYDYVTDTYATGHFEHHFNGFILNKIPLIKKLKLRSLLTFRTAYGTISNENRAINDGVVNKYGTKNLTYNTPNKKLYYEYGVGIENIGYGNLRFLRIDAIWRSKYTPSNNDKAIPTPNFSIRIGIKPGL